MIYPKRKITITILILALLFIIFGIWYKYEYSMYKVEPYEVNSANLSRKLIIATQGSVFKDSITKCIVDYYKQDSIFIKVIDISSLKQIKPENYNAIVVIHTWENWKPPADVQLFMDRTQDYQYKIIVLTTSGRGSFKMENVDAITGESKLENLKSYSNSIIERLLPLLKY